jgi:fatty-acyl-CoA synthase
MKRATPTSNSLELRPANFVSLAEALEYAAKGETGYNFYSSKCELTEAITYKDLAIQAKELARKLSGLGLKKGDRIVIVADTDPYFVRFFFACQYAGFIPVPIPVPVQMGSQSPYVRKTRNLLKTAQPKAVVSSESVLPYVTEAGEGLNIPTIETPEFYYELSQLENELKHIAQPTDTAYIQFTSGSTHSPRGVVISQQQVLNNLKCIISDGVKITRADRCMSWLPFYHDMGLVGLVLVPMTSQISVDFMGTREFAMRPRQWLELISRNKATISFSPPFGYELCERRITESSTAEYDLSSWRVAGVGAETIRPEPLMQFAKTLSKFGFNENAFLACYGMAECSLGVSFTPLAKGISTEEVDSEVLATNNIAVAATANQQTRTSKYVDCGYALPDHDIEIRDHMGKALADRHVGIVFVKGPSVMSHYFNNNEETELALPDGKWLNTGDLGFTIDKRLFITGRNKDLMIVNGKNIWPQDLEFIAETETEVRTGDALAFSAPDWDGEPSIVLVVQCRIKDNELQTALVKRIESNVRREIGINCFVKLVPPHTLPRTSSGKLSRSTARNDYIQQRVNSPRDESTGTQATSA